VVSFICLFLLLENWKVSNSFSKILENTFPKIRKTHFKKLENNFGNLLIFQNVEKADE